MRGSAGEYANNENSSFYANMSDDARTGRAGLGGGEDCEEEEDRQPAPYLNFMRSILFSSQQHLNSEGHSSRRSMAECSRMICQGDSYSHDVCGSQLLDLQLVYGDGGEYGASYSCENLFRDDASVYCTSKSKNVNIVLSHAVKSSNNQEEPVPFVLTGITIKSPPSGYTSPLKDGLIFISDEPICHESTIDFDGFTEEKYRMFMKSRLGKRWGKSSPAIYFKIDQKKPSYIRDLKTPRFGRYILIKLLNSHGKGENIDIQYIGFKGFYGKKAFPAGQIL